MNWQDVKQYCLNRLDEIKEINKTHHCPSSFVCIAAFMGFLSRLAYGNNVAHSQSDGTMFKTFVMNFMPSFYAGKESLIYNTFRNGIVHAMSFDDECADHSSKTVLLKTGHRGGPGSVVITHSQGHNLTPPYVTTKGAIISGVQIVLNAETLCDDIGRAIQNMFADPSVQVNAEAFTKCQRPIQALPLSIQGISSPLLSGSNDSPTQLQGNTP